MPTIGVVHGEETYFRRSLFWLLSKFKGSIEAASHAIVSCTQNS